MFAEHDDLSLETRGLHVEVNVVFIGKKDNLLTLGFGKGLVELCSFVKDKGSLNKAAYEMGMSYSKAWRIIRNAEKILGVELLQRKGAKGSEITKEAEELIQSYVALRQDLSSKAERMVLEMVDRIHECSK